MNRNDGGLVQVAISKFKSVAGKRFRRFLLAAGAAVAASQVTLTFCLSVLNLSAVKSGFVAWVAAAATSYIFSRWAWERKGRPNLLKETLPFWLIAAAAALIQISVAKLVSDVAYRLNLTGAHRIFLIDAAFFLANCFTFLARFFIFHYLLFVDRNQK
jgi:putative flippase GtrA